MGEPVADRLELESGLEEIRSVDAEQDIWTFDDAPVDSERFGELVGDGILESVDDEYGPARR